MSKFYVNVPVAKREIIHLENAADGIHAKYVLINDLSNNQVISNSAYAEIQAALEILCQNLLKEEKYLRTLGSSFAKILEEYDEAEKNNLAHINKSASNPGGNKPQKPNNKPTVEPDYDYQKEVQEILAKLRGEGISFWEWVDLMRDLLTRLSPTDPTKCTLTKAEKEALLRFIGPMMDVVGKIGTYGTAISQEVFNNAIVQALCNNSAFNFIEAGAISLIAPELARLFGFTYNPAEDAYYTQEGCFQQQWGFCDAIDNWGPGLGMDLDTDITTFTVDGQEFRVQLWKGNYGGGFSVGSEFGLYSRSEAEALAQPYVPDSEDSKYILYESVDDKYQPVIKQTTQYTDDNGRVHSFTCDTADYGDGDDFWNLNIKSEAGVDKESIKVSYEIDCSGQGDEFAQAMYESLKNDPDVHDVTIDGTTINVEY